jgi:hypothetical protein
MGTRSVSLRRYYIRLSSAGKFIDEKLPFEYQKCLVGLDSILKHTWSIVNGAEVMERDKLQAMSIGMQAYSMRIELLTNATVVQKAVDFVNRYRDYAGQNSKVTIDSNGKSNSDVDTSEPKQDTG